MSDLPAPRQQQLERCVQMLGLAADTVLVWPRLDQALTHRSVDPDYNYEQLELLGDAVLRLAATEWLQETFPEASVGELSAVRSVLISDRTLAQLAQELGLAPYLLVAPTTKAGPSHLADALEAVVAVLYLETRSLAPVRSLLDTPFQRLADQVRRDPARQNYKVALQELTQAHTKTLPQYRTTEQHPVDGPERYQSTVWFGERCWGSGYGPTKKQAEQAAAAAAYQPLAQALTSPSDEPSPPR